MRIVFADNVLLEERAGGFAVAPQPHLGLISLIAVAREHDHEALLDDPKLALLRGDLRLGPRFYEDAAERVVAAGPDAIGFTSLGCNFACTVRMAAAVRAMRPHVPILLGGPHASIVDREILDAFPHFDAIVRNEAEATLPATLDALGGRGALSAIPGITFRELGAAVQTPGSGPLLDLDALPFPAYDAFPVADLGLTSLRVDAGRGCPFGCTFCSSASFFGRRYRLKSPRRLADELDRLAATYGITHFGLTHDLFTVDARRVRAFCEEIAPRGYTWTCSARTDCVDDALLATMREAGCTAIYYGVETGSPRLQPLVGKHLDLDLYHPRIETSLRLKIDTTVSFIIGYPNETAADRAATLELAGESIARYIEGLAVQLHLLTPEPGTALHAEYRETLAFDGHLTDFNFPLLDPADEALLRAHPDAFVCHHYYRVDDDGRDDAIALADGYGLLYGAGHRLLAALQAASGLAWPAFAREAGRMLRAARGDRGAALQGCVDALLGVDHPLADLVRYRLAVAELRPETARRVDGATATGPIRLSASVVPVREGRDGRRLQQRLHDAAPLDEPALPRTPSLVVGDARGENAGAFAVDIRTCELALVLRAPATRAQLAAAFPEDDLDARLWSLSMMGAIVEPQPGDDIPRRSSIVSSATGASLGGT